MFTRRRTSIRDRVWNNYEQLFHKVQRSASRKCEGCSRGVPALQEVFHNQSTLTSIQYLCYTCYFDSGIRQCSPCLYQFESWCILLSYHCALSILNKKFHFLNQLFQYLAIVEFLPELGKFLEESLGFLSSTWHSSNFVFSSREISFISNVPNHPDPKKKIKWLN